MPLRVVFDSNLYVAAGLRSGGHADLWLDIATLPGSGLDLFVSDDILTEVHEILVRKFDIPATDIISLVKRIRAAATVVVPTQRPTVAADPDDNTILACALESKAHVIISADKDLLDLHPYAGIGIAHPRELKNIFRQDFDSRQL